MHEIGTAYSEIGFASVKNHFLSEELMEQLYDQVKKFFALPIATKEKYEISGLTTLWMQILTKSIQIMF